MKTLILLSILTILGCSNPLAPREKEMAEIPQLTDEQIAKRIQFTRERLKGLWCEKDKQGFCFNYTDTTYTMLAKSKGKLLPTGKEKHYTMKGDSIFSNNEYKHLIYIEHEIGERFLVMNKSFASGWETTLYQWK